MKTNSNKSNLLYFLKDAIEAILGDEGRYREENWDLGYSIENECHNNSKHYLAIRMDGRISYSTTRANNLLLEQR